MYAYIILIGIAAAIAVITCEWRCAAGN